MIQYPNKKSTPSRMSRKRARRDVFIKNKKTTKLRRKAQLLANRERNSFDTDGINQ